jgi:hypothetical protein
MGNVCNIVARSRRDAQSFRPLDTRPGMRVVTRPEPSVSTHGTGATSPTLPARCWAANFLIPPEYEARLRSLHPSEISGFADELGIAPALVVGRLQHEGLIHFSVSKKWKRQLHFVHD